MPSLSSLSTYQDPTFFQPLSQEARAKRAEREAFAGFDYGLGEKPVPKGKWPFPNMAVVVDPADMDLRPGKVWAAVDPGSPKGDMAATISRDYPKGLTASELAAQWKFPKNDRADADFVEYHLGKAIDASEIRNSTVDVRATEDRATITARILADKQKLRPGKKPAMLDVPKPPLPTFDDCVQAIGDALKRGVGQNYIRQLLSAWGAGTAAQLPPACRASFIDALRNVNVAQPKKAPVDGIYDNRATGKREHWVGGRCVRIVSSEAGLVNWGTYPDLPC